MHEYIEVEIRGFLHSPIQISNLLLYEENINHERYEIRHTCLLQKIRKRNSSKGANFLFTKLCIKIMYEGLLEPRYLSCLRHIISTSRD